MDVGDFLKWAESAPPAYRADAAFALARSFLADPMDDDTRHAIEAASDDTGWAGLGAIGSIINKQSPDFDSRNYGFAKLSGLIKGVGLFDTEERQIGNGKHIYVRPRVAKK